MCALNVTPPAVHREEEENELFPHRMKFKGFARALNGAQLPRRRSSEQSAQKETAEKLRAETLHEKQT